MRVRVTLAVALALFGAALAATLSGAPLVPVGDNSVAAKAWMAATYTGRSEACQAGEALPSGTSVIRLTLQSDGGPQVDLRALAGGRVVTSGSVGSGWDGGSVTVPVRTVGQATSNVRICFRLGETKEKVVFVGSQTPASVAARGRGGSVLPGRLRIEYMRAGQRSWWSLLRTVERRLGLGRVPSGVWAALLAVALGAGALLAACWLTVRELS